MTVVRVSRIDGTLAIACTLVYPASQVTLILSHFVSCWRLLLIPVCGAVGLAAAHEAFVCGAIDIVLHATYGEFVSATRMVNQVTGLLPPESFDVSGNGWSYLRGCTLADP